MRNTLTKKERRDGNLFLSRETLQSLRERKNRVAIVGASAKYWNKGQEDEAKAEIAHIIYKHGESRTDSIGWILGFDFKDLVIISGGASGVDTWAETTAKKLGVDTLIFRPEVAQWEDQTYNALNPTGRPRPGIIGFAMGRRKGYMSRNIDIAQNCTILYLIEVAGRSHSGGMWTADYAESIDKEVHRIFIE
jgi:hypothetical protein